MKNPIKLTIDEQVPGSFVWTLLETDTSGTPRKVLKTAEYGSDTYEAALAAGTRVMDAEIRRSLAPHHDGVTG
ncbi:MULTISPECIES: hypothetical protein [unclassified Variovorax]|uniref:hypothetical protein n=1 Tax=unclassified Variovorax TaxID=663243 RepID=UPI001315E9D5|nr:MULTISPECIES: hypothetical protein [unclassified Variovorax]VTU15537.1 hypothetical protein SRS16CHR_01515 [Variovorax sp. SRS16]VTU23478.1 hypothetical protein E5CHR_01598 [Variovorax sp. PBL-E5]